MQVNIVAAKGPFFISDALNQIWGYRCHLALAESHSGFFDVVAGPFHNIEEAMQWLEEQPDG